MRLVMGLQAYCSAALYRSILLSADIFRLASAG